MSTAQKNDRIDSVSPALHRFRGLFHTLRARLIVSVALVHVVLMGMFTWEAVDRQSQELRQELIHQADSLASLMVVATTNALLAEDLASLAEVTRRVNALDDVAYGEIVDIRGYVMASTRDGRVGQKLARMRTHRDRFPLPKGDSVLDFVEAVRVGDQEAGYVMLGLSTRNLDQELAASRNQGALYIALALIIGSFVAWLLSLAVTRNLQELTVAADRIAGGDLNVRVKVRGQDETSMLARAFNSMVLSLQHSAQAIEKEHRKRTDAERLACVGEMAASIAHEIRNPLAALINAMKLLGSPGLAEEDHQEVVQIVNSESYRLQRILNEFLAFARLPEAVLTAADVTELITQTIQQVKRDPACRENIRIETRFEDVTPCLFDRDQMRQVLLNLMMNALQAISASGHLTLQVKRQGELVVVSLVDDGCGIKASLKDEVTMPFVTARKGGTGLGLSVVQRILVQHGTTLNISSEEGVGTEVSFELMIAP